MHYFFLKQLHIQTRPVCYFSIWDNYIIFIWLVLFVHKTIEIAVIKKTPKTCRLSTCTNNSSITKTELNGNMEEMATSINGA